MIIQSPLEKESLSFYRRLNFTITEDNGQYFATDGLIIIRFRKGLQNPGIMVFRNNTKVLIEELSSVIEVKPVNEGFVFTDPSGTEVTIVESSENIGNKDSKSQISLLGNFAGISIGLAEPAESIKLWEILGLKIVAGSSDQGWAAMADENGSVISILNRDSCPHKFFNPSLSYFNGTENMRIIEGIRKAGINIEEEITVFNDKGIVDNIIVRDPGGLGFFIFSD